MRFLSRRGLTAGLLAGVVLAAGFAAGPASGISGPPAPTDGYGFVAHVQLRPNPNGPRPGSQPLSEPYQACSGVLVDPEWVITAGRCHADVWADWPPIATVTVGSQARGVAEKVRHPSRSLWLFKLDSPVAGVAPAKISTTPAALGETLQVAGLGRTATEWVPERPHVGAFRVEAVSEAAVDIVSNQSPPASVCAGDAGGPALRAVGSGFEVVALNERSWQAGCLGVPASETRTNASEVRLDNVKDWVQQTVRGDTFVRLSTSAAVLDTRSGIGASAGPRAAGSLTHFPVTGVGGIPATGVTAVLVDVTAVTTNASTTLTVYPSRTIARPDASTVSAAANQIISNTAVVPVPPSTGDLTVHSSAGGTHIVVDVQGYYTDAANTGGGFVPVDHTRVVDTRTGLGGSTGTVSAGQSRTFTFTGGVIPAGASTAFLDLVVTGATVRGWIGTGTGNRSVMDYAVGSTSHAVAVQLGSDGRATFTNNTGSPVHFAMTATGYFTAGATTGTGLRTLTAARKLDTRAGGGQPLAVNGTIDVALGIPAGSTALVNLTVLQNTGGGYLRAWPVGGAEPVPSLTTFPDPNTAPRSGLAAVKVGTDGKIRIKNNSTGTTHLLVDLQGWYAQPLA